jgi:hypothetical protein
LEDSIAARETEDDANAKKNDEGHVERYDFIAEEGTKIIFMNYSVYQRYIERPLRVNLIKN